MDPRIEMLIQRAASLRRAGRTDEAIAAYEQLLSAEPDRPDSWYNLAWLQRQARRYAQRCHTAGNRAAELERIASDALQARTGKPRSRSARASRHQ